MCSQSDSMACLESLVHLKSDHTDCIHPYIHSAVYDGKKGTLAS